MRIYIVCVVTYINCCNTSVVDVWFGLTADTAELRLGEDYGHGAKVYTVQVTRFLAPTMNVCMLFSMLCFSLYVCLHASLCSVLTIVYLHAWFWY